MYCPRLHSESLWELRSKFRPLLCAKFFLHDTAAESLRSISLFSMVADNMSHTCLDAFWFYNFTIVFILQYSIYPIWSKLCLPGTPDVKIPGGRRGNFSVLNPEQGVWSALRNRSYRVGFYGGFYRREWTVHMLLCSLPIRNCNCVNPCSTWWKLLLF